MKCDHDPKYGLMLLPKEANGCLACHAEQQAGAIKQLTAENKHLKSQIAEVRERMKKVTSLPTEFFLLAALADWIDLLTPPEDE